MLGRPHQCDVTGERQRGAELVVTFGVRSLEASTLEPSVRAAPAPTPTAFSLEDPHAAATPRPTDDRDQSTIAIGRHYSPRRLEYAHQRRQIPRGVSRSRHERQLPCPYPRRPRTAPKNMSAPLYLGVAATDEQSPVRQRHRRTERLARRVTTGGTQLFGHLPCTVGAHAIHVDSGGPLPRPRLEDKHIPAADRHRVGVPVLSDEWQHSDEQQEHQ